MRADPPPKKSIEVGSKAAWEGAFLEAATGLGGGVRPPEPSVSLARKRRGAINSKQLTYLEKYRPKQRLRFKDPQNHKNKCCIM